MIALLRRENTEVEADRMEEVAQLTASWDDDNDHDLGGGVDTTQAAPTETSNEEAVAIALRDLLDAR